MTERIGWMLVCFSLAFLAVGRVGASRTPIEKILEENIASDLELVQALRSGRSQPEMERILKRIESDLRRQRYTLR